MLRELCLLAWALPVAAQRGNERFGCTAIGIDGGASSDGSAFAGMNADSGDADYRLTFIPARHHEKGTRRQVFTFNLSYPRWVGYGRGEFFHPDRPDAPLSEPCGEIPEVQSTFGYYEATEPLMNDQGLGLGESSCAAMLQNRFPGDRKDTRDVPVGMLDTVTLMQLSLERCATARCAVEVMGRLVEDHGFVPTPGEPTVGEVRGREARDDAGEAYTLADRTGEAWVFHVLGGVTGVTKSVWAARKVPKGHIVVVPNEFIIGELPEEPNDEFLFNRESGRAAMAAGLWDGKGKLHFARVFAPDPLAFEAPAGATPIPLYGSLRRWGIYNKAAPSLNLRFSPDDLDLPFSVRIEKVISHRDVMGYFRYQYEGTEFDLTKGMLAGPFGNPFRLEGGPKTGQVPRGIAIQRTLYGIIAHTGPQEQLGWFAHDAPTTAVYVPLYSRVDAVSTLFSSGRQSEFSRNSAWAFNFVSNFMQLNYDAMSKNDVYPAIETWQDIIDQERMDAHTWGNDRLHKWQASLQERVTAGWWKLSEFLIMKYNDGKTNHPKVGVSWAYPEWYAEAVGFGNDVHPLWSQAASVPPRSLETNLLDYVRPVIPLPQEWNHRTATWSWGAAANTLSATAAGSQGLVTLAVACASMLFGVGVGRVYERRRPNKIEATYAPLL